MNSIDGVKIQAQGGLYSAYQTAQVKIKKSMGEKDMKLGLEIKMIPIVNGKEDDRFKPRSFFVNKGELCKWDQLIFEMVKFRWLYAKKSGWLKTRLSFARDELERRKMLEELIGWFKSKISEAINKGLMEGKNEKKRIENR